VRWITRIFVLSPFSRRESSVYLWPLMKRRLQPERRSWHTGTPPVAATAHLDDMPTEFRETNRSEQHVGCRMHDRRFARQIGSGADTFRLGPAADSRTAANQMNWLPAWRHRPTIPRPTTIGMNRFRTYSITSFARASRFGGMVMPSAFAVLRLIANSYLVGACTGRFAGFSPLRMRSI